LRCISLCEFLDLEHL